MSTIIAGRFETQLQIQQVIGELLRAGFSTERIASFYVNPPGQHDTYPIGGDEEISPGAEDTPKGAIAGVAAGAAAGLAAAPVVGPVGPLLGAYIGSLVGSLSETKDEDMRDEHRAGLMVAVVADDAESQRNAINILRSMGGADLECAEGTIEDGDWVDFNPVSAPRLLRNGAERCE